MTYLEIRKKLQERGGAYLGHARSWVQRKFVNGENVTWGSQDILHGNPIRVSDIEEIAVIAATAALEENCKAENRICMFCIAKTKYPWLDCSLGCNYNKAIEIKSCSKFKLKENIFVLNL